MSKEKIYLSVLKDCFLKRFSFWIIYVKWEVLTQIWMSSGEIQEHWTSTSEGNRKVTKERFGMGTQYDSFFTFNSQAEFLKHKRSLKLFLLISKPPEASAESNCDNRLIVNDLQYILQQNRTFKGHNYSDYLKKVKKRTNFQHY